LLFFRASFHRILPETLHLANTPLFGIVVRVWHDDHPPPHIHVEDQGFEALARIEDGEVAQGRLPRKVAKIVREWCLEHRQQLLDN
jgi:hypothetical protein